VAVILPNSQPTASAIATADGSAYDICEARCGVLRLTIEVVSRACHLLSLSLDLCPGIPGDTAEIFL
jgi:hypothetical protein